MEVQVLFAAQREVAHRGGFLFFTVKLELDFKTCGANTWSAEAQDVPKGALRKRGIKLPEQYAVGSTLIEHAGKILENVAIFISGCWLTFPNY